MTTGKLYNFFGSRKFEASVGGTEKETMKRGEVRRILGRFKVPSQSLKESLLRLWKMGE